MAGSITEFGLGLPAGWHMLPTSDGDSQWAEDMAAELASGSAALPDAPGLLAKQLKDVRASVGAVGVSGLRTAVLIDSVTDPLVTAMLTIGVGSGADVERYKAELEHVAHEVEDAQVMGQQIFDAEVPAGPVVGSHLLIGHMVDGAGEAGAHLEERVHAAVFPPGTGDALEIMVVAANVGLFENLPVTVVDLLEGMTFRTEGGA
ncbi:hypothetical protein ACFS27_27995 [Promicromonospora vindobonensis]|uniref:Uncharacterized protein n=1 Tax=Promicromonospora vindobonensis TaxID=195748 RepID=A0ABW5W0K7_9MICO